MYSSLQSFHLSDFDLPGSSNNEKRCLDSNNIQNAANLYWPAVKLSRLPIEYNTKSFLLKHFQSFGPVERIICQPSMDAAYIAFNSLVSTYSVGSYVFASSIELPTLSYQRKTKGALWLTSLLECIIGCLDGEDT